MSNLSTIKVLHVIDSGGLYGAERLLISLAKEQKRAGLDVVIVSVGKKNEGPKLIEEAAARQGLSVKVWRMKPGLNVAGAMAILTWARNQGFDLIHSHGYKFNVLIGMVPGRIRGIPFVATLHGYIQAPFLSKSWLYQCLDRISLRIIESVVLVSHSMRDQIPLAISRSSKTKIVSNGLDYELVKQELNRPVPPSIRSFLQDHGRIVLGVGRLSPEKGFFSLIEAFAVVRQHYPDAGLLIIGEGGLRGELEAKVVGLGIRDHILMPGYIESVIPIMAASTVLCIPSLTEGLPITLLEAMAVGLPILATPVGEIPAVLGEGRGGRILPSGDVEILGKELIDYLGDQSQQQRLAQWAKAQVHEVYSSVAMQVRYRQIYEQLVI